MPAPDPRIIRFIKRHHVLNLATVSELGPWACSCFYVFTNEPPRFLFTSDKSTRHISEAMTEQRVAGTITLETKIIGKIRGLQFTGRMAECTGEAFQEARRLYLKRFPYAAPFMGGTALWEISVDQLKLTDNRLGFGKKLIWCKNS